MYRFLALLLLSFALPVAAQSPDLDAPVPPLVIDSRGELLLHNDEFDYAPWSTGAARGKVHVMQYFAGTMSASETFKPFTDRLQELFELGTYHVTTIINLDAALWGTGSFVISQVKSNKRKFPQSTLVLDEDGIGAKTWRLGKAGAGLLILDGQGVVRYFTRQPMNTSEIDASVELIRSYIEG